MDFFERQDDARRRTKLLAVYFIFAVIGIIASIYLVVLAAKFFMREKSSSSGYGRRAVPAKFTLWDPVALGGAAAGSLLVILLGSGYKSMQLSAGGSRVALDLGGRRIDGQTTDPDERRLLNVVEEMAIASGVPVPQVYVMEDENSINAFAAGRTPSDAVIGVTRGCMTLLTRDELQGVIAHEFSHILNGDMRLNLRLIGLIFGILVIAICGRIITRMAIESGAGRNSKGGNLAFVLVGVALIVIGYVGVFFGKLIKAAISREREYLADASAVQFTRNPDGIGGALKKIGGFSRGSRIGSALAEEASHMFFANGLGSSFSEALATHPPLEKRIRAIDPSWDGRYPPTVARKINEARAEEKRAERPAFGIPGMGGVGIGVGGMITAAAAAAEAESLVKSVGTLSEAQVRFATQLRDSLPGDWRDALQTTGGAQAMLFGLLLAQDDALRGAELEHLRAETDGETYRQALAFHTGMTELDSSQKLALVDLSIPTLRRLPPDEYDRFGRIVAHLVASDQQIDLFEFTLQKIIKRHLDIAFRRADPPRIEFRHMADLADDAAVLLVAMAQLGQARDPQAARAAFAAGAGELDVQVKAPQGQIDLNRIGSALDRFDRATPLVKKQILRATSIAAMADAQITDQEIELLRAIADTIGCPIPPFVRMERSGRSVSDGSAL